MGKEQKVIIFPFHYSENLYFAVCLEDRTIPFKPLGHCLPFLLDVSFGQAYQMSDSPNMPSRPWMFSGFSVFVWYQFDDIDRGL